MAKGTRDATLGIRKIFRFGPASCRQGLLHLELLVRDNIVDGSRREIPGKAAAGSHLLRLYEASRRRRTATDSIPKADDSGFAVETVDRFVPVGGGGVRY